jgi:hypothetical protein
MLRLLERLVFTRKPCPFCDRECSFQADHQLYWCAECQTKFQEAEEEGGGDYLEPVYGPECSAQSGPTRSTPFHPMLCQPCNNHQSIIVQLLSAYEHEGTAEEMLRYQQELDRRYPLCHACKAAVGERLKQIDFRLRTRLFAREGPTALRRCRERTRSTAHHRVLLALAKLGTIVLTGSLFLDPSQLLVHPHSLPRPDMSSTTTAGLLVVLAVSILICPSLLCLLVSALSIALYKYLPHNYLPHNYLPHKYLSRHRPPLDLFLASIILVNALSTAYSRTRRQRQLAVVPRRTDLRGLSIGTGDNKENAGGRGRNPFLSKTLLNATPTASWSMPTSPSSQSARRGQSLKPTSLVYPSIATGLEQHLDSFSLSNRRIDQPLTGPSRDGDGFYWDVLRRLTISLGLCALRCLQRQHLPLQAVIFAAAFGLESGLLGRRLRPLTLALSMLRLPWLGYECTLGDQAFLDELNRLLSPLRVVSLSAHVLQWTALIVDCAIILIGK